MAIELLLQSKQITVEEINSFKFIGELSLNAELRPRAKELIIYSSMI